MRRTQALMLKFTDYHKQLLKNSKLKVLKFAQLAPEDKLDDTSSDDNNKEPHELEAKYMFDKHRRTSVGGGSQKSSRNGSYSSRS